MEATATANEGEQDMRTEDAEEIALRKKLMRRQFYLCFTERVRRDGDPYKDLEPHLKEHLRWIADLERRDVAFAAGPFRDQNDSSYWNGDGMFILRAKSREEAAAIADTCPFHQSGLRTYRIVPWWMNEGSLKITLRCVAGEFELS